MKKKFIIPLALIFTILSSSIVSFAYTYNDFDFAPYKTWIVFKYDDSSTVQYNFYMCYSYNPISVSDSNNGISVSNLTGIATCNTEDSAALPLSSNFTIYSVSSNYNFTNYGYNRIYAIIGGNYSGSAYEHFSNNDDYYDYLYPPAPTPTPSFWELTWDGFWDALEIVGDGLEMSDNALWDWIKSIFTDEETTPDYNAILVTPAPTPTPIPVTYQTVTVTDGNGGSVTSNQYVYKDENNNTIVATAIPTNGIVINLPSGGSGNGSGSTSDPSSYSPANPLAIPDYSWLNPHAFAENQNQFPLQTLQDSEDFTKDAAENYLTGVTGIFSLLSFIPQELYVVVGIGISIIVIAGIMCKLLGG